MKPKISAVSHHNNRWRPYWSFPLIKKMLQKTLYFSAFVYSIPFSFIKDDLSSTLSISAIQNTQIIMLRINSVGTTSACDPASIFACPQCGMRHLVYMRYLWFDCSRKKKCAVVLSFYLEFLLILYNH